MNEAGIKKNNFIGYEYQEVNVKQEMESVYVDGYQNFGWKLEGTSTPTIGVNCVTIKFKRDRKIRNKAELTRLQRQFDACMHEIEALERSKSTSAEITAYSTGLLGTGLIAGATFSYLDGMLPLMIILAVPGFIGWISPYFCYRSIKEKKTLQADPLIYQKYDELYAVCEKANGLLSI